MVWNFVLTALGGAVLGGGGSDAEGGSNALIQNAMRILIILLIIFAIIMTINVFCYFSSSCSNIWDVLIPDWFKEIPFVADIIEGEDSESSLTFTQKAGASVATGVVAYFNFFFNPFTERRRNFYRRVLE